MHRDHPSPINPCTRLCLGLLLLLAARPAWAAKVVSFDVPRQGGAFVVDVHPDVLTVLYFPAGVSAAYCVQQPPPMVVKQHAQSVTVQPLPGVAHASVNVSTKRFRVGVLLRVVDRAEDATLQVEFRDRDLEREFEQRVRLEVERRMLGKERALEKREAALQVSKARFSQIVADTAIQRVADGIRTRHRTLDLDTRARQASVVLRVRRIVWLGPDAYVVFSLQNRGPSPFRLGDVTLRAGGLERTGAVSFPDAESAARRGIVGIVPPRARHTGVVVLRDAVDWIGETVSVFAIEDRINETPAGAPLSASFFLKQ